MKDKNIKSIISYGCYVIIILIPVTVATFGFAETLFGNCLLRNWMVSVGMAGSVSIKNTNRFISFILRMAAMTLVASAHISACFLNGIESDLSLSVNGKILAAVVIFQVGYAVSAQNLINKITASETLRFTMVKAAERNGL